MRHFSLSCIFSHYILAFTAILMISAPACAKSELSSLYDQVYQIVVIDTETNNKAALGSGFQVSSDGLIITNYHVISHQVFKPENHRIEFVDHRHETGTLELITFDIINDLALLKRRKAPSAYLDIATLTPIKGDSIYAIGNPHDVGMLLVNGAYNGLTDSSYTDRILFSGSLNPGMSGGPTVNSNGEVVGVNVSTAGSQLSFLVPIKKIIPLIQTANKPLEPESYPQFMSQQISNFQNAYFKELMNSKWKLENLGDETQVFGEIGVDTNCWGNSNEGQEKSLYKQLNLICQNSNIIYLKPKLNTGALHYSYTYLESLSLNNYQFHKVFSNQFYSPDNRAHQGDVTSFNCQQEYLNPKEKAPTGHFIQVGFCSRAYIELTGLYDILFYQVNAGKQKALISHFTLAGISLDIANAFTQRFLNQVQWKELEK